MFGGTVHMILITFLDPSENSYTRFVGCSTLPFNPSFVFFSSEELLFCVQRNRIMFSQVLDWNESEIHLYHYTRKTILLVIIAIILCHVDLVLVLDINAAQVQLHEFY